MSQKPFDLEDQLQRHGRSLRRLAFELVHDGTEVDDALQETWLRVLRHPPQRAAQAEGWLATVLRHVVFRSRRGERRRRAREQAVARDAVASDPGVVAAQAEIAERLLAVVRGLEEPYRAAIWQRYFEDLPPREIAVRQGVPLATVKSRLQRGLQQLRERLGEGEGGESDWRGALAVAFGLGVEKGAAAAGTAAALAGGVCMAAWMKVVTAAVAAGVVLWWWWPIAPTVAVPSTTVASVDAVAAQAPVAGDAPPATVTQERRVVASEHLAGNEAPMSAPKATLRGRCVDTDGNPLAACTVKLTGSARLDQEMDAWLRDHADPAWQDPEVTTGADGMFTIPFEPPPPFQFFAEIRHPTFTGGWARWKAVAPGAHIDLGDIRLQSGVLLTGILVDEDGRAVGEALLTASRIGEAVTTAEDQFRDTTSSTVETGADGRFASLRPLPPGKYKVEHHRPGPVLLGEIELPADRATVAVRLVTKSQADGPKITGRIVDANGQPIAKVYVTALPNGRRAYAQRDGTFVVGRFDGAPDTVRLEAECAGYEPATTEKPIAWGSQDVEIVLQNAPALVVRVTDPDERPVEQYSVRLLPREHDRSSGSDFAVRARGPFENGTAAVTGVTTGKWTVMVEFPTASSLVTIFAPIDIDPGMLTRRLDLRAELPASRMLHVVSTTGEPVVGTRVQVCDLVDGVFDANTFLLQADKLFRMAGGKRALVCWDGMTDADGRCELRGPGSRAVGLALLGPGHVPLRENGVWLNLAGELAVTVSIGARLTGRIVPPAAIDELRRLQGLGPGVAFPDGHQPSIELSRKVGRSYEKVPGFGEDDESPFRIDDAGAFDVRSLKPGTWTLRIRRDVSLGTGSMRSAFDVTTIELRDGATTTVDLDLSGILPGTLEGTVQHNGKVLTNTDVQLQCTFRVGGRDQPSREGQSVRTDAEGAFSFVGRPGEYRVSVRANGDRFAPTLRSATSVTVVSGQTTRHAFAIWSGTMKVTLRDETGAPAANVTLLVDDGSDRTPSGLPPTDKDGVVDVELPAGTVTVMVLPKRLQSPEAQNQLWQDARATGIADPQAPHRLSLGTVTVRANQPTAIELQLPPAWRQ